MARKSLGKTSKVALCDAYSAPDFERIVLSNPQWGSAIRQALNYANYVFEVSDCKSFAHEYCKENLKLSAKSVPDWEWRHKGAICWILNNGGEIRDLAGFHNEIKELVGKYKNANTTDDEETPVLALHEIKAKQMAENTSDLIAELEGIIDDVVNGKSGIINPSEFYKKAGIFKQSAVSDHFQIQFDDFNQGGEGYDELSADYKKRVKIALTFIIKQLDEHKTEIKAIKAVRVKKPRKIVPSKMVRKLKYKRSDDDHKLKSVAPEKIVTADALWVFDVKKRKMTHYVSQDKVGLLVKGTAIKNFDPDLSQTKALRKPEKFFAALEKAGKVEQRSLLASIKGKSKPAKGRINEHCILVKVY